MHGKASTIAVSGEALFAGVPRQIVVGRYHSLVADPATLPGSLAVTARTEDGVVMALEHASEPIAAVQFHPESIMTLRGEAGLRIVENVMRMARETKARRAAARRRSA